MAWANKQIGKGIDGMRGMISKFLYKDAYITLFTDIAGKSPKILYDNKTYTLYLGLSYSLDDMSMFSSKSYAIDKYVAEGKIEVKKPGEHFFWTVDKKKAEAIASSKRTAIGVLVEYKCPPKFMVADLTQSKYLKELGLIDNGKKEVCVMLPKGTKIPVKSFYNGFQNKWKSPADMKKDNK